MKMELNLEQVLDLKKWEVVQESIALATQLAIILVDYKGKPVTKHSQVRPFCNLARNDPVLSAYCEKCDARGGLESARTGQPYIYRCHFDIIDLSIPIMIDNNYVGAILAGEIQVQPEEKDQLEQILTLKDQAPLQKFIEQHYTEYHSYPVFSLADLNAAATMIEKLSEYIVSEAIKKDYLITAYKQTLHLTSRKKAADENNELEYVQKDVNRSLLESRLDHVTHIYRAKNKLLQPAIDAVYENKSEHLSLADLAKLINISPNYLSRLIKEEFGTPFSQIYAQLKINWAKELLVETDLTIAEISDELGYVEPSYFVRSFKKVAGITPLKYRKQEQN